MEAKELMMSNFVTVDNPQHRPNETGKVARIIEIAPEHCGVVMTEGSPYNTTFSQFYNYLKPIPLTQEWLIKFGFEKLNSESNIYKNKSLVCTMDGDDLFCEITENGTYLSFVHQLQNLYYALTGEELMIKKQ